MNGFHFSFFISHFLFPLMDFLNHVETDRIIQAAFQEDIGSGDVTAISVISIGAALWIGSTLGNISYGFFIVGGFYCLAGLLVYFFRENIWM